MKGIPRKTARPAPSSPGRRARRQAETRARILHAALNLFARQGLPATTIEQITEAADVGKGTFFNYFPSKEHVMAGFGEIQLAKLQRALERTVSGAEPTREFWSQLIHELAREPGQSPNLVRGLMAANLASASVMELTQANLARGRELLAELIRMGQARGELRSDLDPARTARTVQQMLLGTLLLWALDPSVEFEPCLDATFEFFWSRVARPTAENPPERQVTA
jgi:AcrR family transcriptional regulator